MEEEKLAKINNELKVCINEASFVSMKCRNRILKIFCEEFCVSLDISNYQNVDLKIQEDYTILYRDDVYSSEDNISDFEELEKRYLQFMERANRLIQKKEVDFQNKSNWNNIWNIIIILLLLLFLLGIILLVIRSLLIGDYYNFLWLIIFIIPMVVPRMKESLSLRIQQAKNYLKKIFGKAK